MINWYQNFVSSNSVYNLGEAPESNWLKWTLIVLVSVRAIELP